MAITDSASCTRLPGLQGEGSVHGRWVSAPQHQCGHGQTGASKSSCPSSTMTGPPKSRRPCVKGAGCSAPTGCSSACSGRCPHQSPGGSAPRAAAAPCRRQTRRSSRWSACTCPLQRSTGSAETSVSFGAGDRQLPYTRPELGHTRRQHSPADSPSAPPGCMGAWFRYRPARGVGGMRGGGPAVVRVAVQAGASRAACPRSPALRTGPCRPQRELTLPERAVFISVVHAHPGGTVGQQRRGLQGHRVEGGGVLAGLAAAGQAQGDGLAGRLVDAGGHPAGRQGGAAGKPGGHRPALPGLQPGSRQRPVGWGAG